MNLGKALEALKYDNRMKDWNLSQGLVTKEELEHFDTSLQDVSDRAAAMDLDAESARASSTSDSSGMPQ